MPKDMESLKKSRKERAEIINMFGGKVPESIMKHNKSDSAIDLFGSGKKSSRSRTTEYKEKTRRLVGNGMDLVLSNVFGHTPDGSSGRGGKDTTHTLSLFPQSVGRNLIKFYISEGDIVIDPFAGHNSRMELCWKAERHYYGQDICHDFMEANREIKKMLIKEQGFFENNTKIELSEGDSKKLPWPDEFGDFTITSPPYWDMEYYGDEKEQLGFLNTYDGFLDGLYEIAVENYRCLKKNSFCVWFVNDFRKNKKFYNYHGDVIRLMEDAGFIQWDIVIVDLGSSLRSIFASSVIKSKILPKRHEYALVFKKV